MSLVHREQLELGPKRRCGAPILRESWVGA